MNYCCFPSVIYIFMCCSEIILCGLIKHTQKGLKLPSRLLVVGALRMDTAPQLLTASMPFRAHRVQSKSPMPLICTSLICAACGRFLFYDGPHFRCIALLRAPLYSPPPSTPLQPMQPLNSLTVNRLLLSVSVSA